MKRQHQRCNWGDHDVLSHGAEVCARIWQMISFDLIGFQLLNLIHTSPFGVQPMESEIKSWILSVRSLVQPQI